MAYPRKIAVHELGPREGMQIEKTPIPTSEKIRLIDMLSECNFPEIETTSFVSPKWVPQMADAEQVVAGFKRRPGTLYTCIYLNKEGMARAVATGKLDVAGNLSITASETFSKKNTNRTIEESLAETERRIEALQSLNVPINQIGVMAAFGCNYQGDISPAQVISTLEDGMRIAEETGAEITYFSLADTMGWAAPHRMERMLGEVRSRWPEMKISLHLHDTRGLAVANAHAALKMGVAQFDSTVGGLGGCPFAGQPKAAGNICTEELVLLCEEMGIETGVDLDALIEVGRMAEDIVGHQLPSELIHAGSLDAFRRKAAH